MNPYWNMPRWIPLVIRQWVLDVTFAHYKERFEAYCKQIDPLDWEVVAADTLLTSWRNGDMVLWWVWEWRKKCTEVTTASQRPGSG